MQDFDPEPYLQLAASGIEREYPNQPQCLMLSDADAKSPRELHPVFYGCFDWHSAVHSHWTLVRLLRLFPQMGSAESVTELLNRQFTDQKLLAEAKYFDRSENRAFERMYGWAWTLQLGSELHLSTIADAKNWRAAIIPLEEAIVDLMMDYLPKLRNPNRTGNHPDTGFALGMAWDYAHVVGNDALKSLIESRGLAFYEADRDYPFAFEPSGEDFFSSGLNEADFMRRILGQEEFVDWLTDFAPSLADGFPLSPCEDVDLSDGRLAHQAGLNLSRAWTLCGIANALPDDDERRVVCESLMESHLAPLEEHVFSGQYEGEHWLGTFAVYLLTK